MLLSAKNTGHEIKVTDVNGNVNQRLSQNTDVTLWNGGNGQIFHGQIEISAPHFDFVGRADRLLRQYGLLVKVNGISVASW